MTDMNEIPSIDIVIPASGTWRNPYLFKTLDSLMRQSFPSNLLHITIVHVSRPDGDNDVSDLSERCKEIGASIVFIKQEDPSFNISKAYNAGVRAGSREAVACIDGDVYFHPDTLSYAAKAVMKGNAAVIPVVRTSHKPGDEEMINGVLNVSCPDDWEKLTQGNAWGRDANGNAVFPRKIYEEIHGYDERYYGWGGADNDIVSRVRRRIVVVDLIRVGCPKSLHMEHKRRASVESSFTRRNRGILSTSKEVVRNQEAWGGIPVVYNTVALDSNGETCSVKEEHAKGHVPYDRTFCGVKAQHAAVTYENIDRIIDGSTIRRIVELGTADGALSSYLGLRGVMSNIPVYTFDKKGIPDERIRNLLNMVGVQSFRVDVLSEQGKVAVRSVVSDDPVYLICDNGNKSAEFASFAQHLVPGSIVSVHDWMYEIFPRHTDEIVQKLGLVPFEQERWVTDQLRMATWTVPDRGQRPIDFASTSIGYNKMDGQPGWHRETVGGMFAEIGRAQLEMLRKSGLEQSDRLLDVGCGSLRLGVRAIEYLNESLYCGVDCDRDIVMAGFENELSEELKKKNPSFQFNSKFDFSGFGDRKFDMATAHSVFTHLPPQDIERCLRNVLGVLTPGKPFFATYNEQGGGFSHFGHVYPEMTRYSFDFFRTLARRCGASVTLIGQWGIPQNKRGDQLLMKFVAIQ